MGVKNLLTNIKQALIAIYKEKITKLSFLYQFKKLNIAFIHIKGK